jgi:exocyst complex component 3
MKQIHIGIRFNFRTGQKKFLFFFRQLSLAQANLDYIIKTPENVKKADELMGLEKLLQAHQLIMEIENSRNYLLFELHKVQEKDSQQDDIQLVTSYFADYERLVAHLRQLISFRISRWYDCAISAPEKLVTALRIIEREEQYEHCFFLI